MILWLELLLFVLLALFFLQKHFAKHTEKHLQTIRFYKANLYECESLFEKLQKQRDALLQKGCVIREEHIIIGKDNLPMKPDSKEPCKLFTVYSSPHGKKLHRKCGCGNAKIKHHIYAVRPAENLSALLCSRCADEAFHNIVSFLELAAQNEAALRLAGKKLDHLSSLHRQCISIPKQIRRREGVSGCDEWYDKLRKTKSALYLDFQKIFFQNYFGFENVECYNVTYSDYPPAERSGREYTSPAIVRPLSEDPASGYRLFRTGLSNGGCRTFLKDTDIIYPGKECALSDSEGRMCYILLSHHPKRLL